MNCEPNSLKPCTRQQLHMVWPRNRLHERPTWSLPAGYTLRNWREGDGEAYTRLARDAGFRTWMLEHILQESLPQGLFFILEERGGRIVASAVARHQPTQLHPLGGELAWVAVDSDHRGRGLGFAVSAAATKRLLDAGYSDVYLKTDDHRLAALKLYLRLGYIPFVYAPGMDERWRVVWAALQWPSDAHVARAS